MKSAAQRSGPNGMAATAARYFAVTKVRRTLMVRYDDRVRSSFSTIRELGNADTRIALQLTAQGPVGEVNQYADPMGTAVVIAPYLAITAKHVVQDYRDKYGITGDETEARFILSALMAMEDGKTVLEFRVAKMVLCQHTDVALLQLNGDPNLLPFQDWVTPEIDLIPPPIGSRVATNGYCFAEVISQDDAARSITISREFADAHGEVVDAFERRRDSHNITFPAVQVSAPFLGGMSGGPVYDRNARLCGLVSTGLALEDGDLGEPISYVALLWPILDTIIDFGVPGRTEPHTIFDLITMGVIRARGIDDFEVTIEHATNFCRIRRRVPDPSTWITLSFSWNK